MNVDQSFKKCSILTPDIRKQPQTVLRINLKVKSRFINSWLLEGAMYINPWYDVRGHPKNICFMKFSQNIDDF